MAYKFLQFILTTSVNGGRYYLADTATVTSPRMLREKRYANNLFIRKKCPWTDRVSLRIDEILNSN